MSDSDTFDPNAPTDELISFALSHPETSEDVDPYWEVVAMLHKRGTRDVFEAATDLLAKPAKRRCCLNSALAFADRARSVR